MSETPRSHQNDGDEREPDRDTCDPRKEPPENTRHETLRKLFESVEPGLRAFLRGRLRQPSDIDDCLQVVFVKLVESGGDVRPAAMRAWLFRVAANESAGMWRSEATRNRVMEKRGGDDEFADDDPADRAIQTETARKLRQHLNELPEAWQQIVRLRIDQNLTFREIADQLGIPLGTALTQMRRSLERLRSELEDD